MEKIFLGCHFSAEDVAVEQKIHTQQSEHGGKWGSWFLIIFTNYLWSVKLKICDDIFIWSDHKSLEIMETASSVSLTL